MLKPHNHTAEKPPHPIPNLEDIQNLEVMGQKILIRRWPKQANYGETTIEIPDAFQSSQQGVGWVEKKGGSTSPNFKVGQTVIFPEHAVMPMAQLGEDFIYIEAQDIIGIYK